MNEPFPDGIHGLLPRGRMSPAARKLRDVYDVTPGAPFPQREFGFFCWDRWFEQGLPRDADMNAEFGFEPLGLHTLMELGWCEAAFCPPFEEKVLEDRGGHELVQDVAGRGVLCFKGRRSGFMPHYETHPVHDMQSWAEHCAWRLDPATPERYATFDERMAEARAAAARGELIVQRLIGAAMYLRSLMGPEHWLLKFYTDPDLVRACMESWFNLADAVIARHQQHVTLDELFLAEDICFNCGPLIAPDTVRQFFFSYYRQLIANIRRRQLDPTRKLHIQIDTDGDARTVIDLYREIGMTAMSPFEVASGCDVVEIGRQYPDLIMLGGIDKRILASTPEKIDRMVDRIFPAMQARGGYIPTCDHGVPEEVSLENYRHYRRRCLEFA